MNRLLESLGGMVEKLQEKDLAYEDVCEMILNELIFNACTYDEFVHAIDSVEIDIDEDDNITLKVAMGGQQMN